MNRFAIAILAFLTLQGCDRAAQQTQSTAPDDSPPPRTLALATIDSNPTPAAPAPVPVLPATAVKSKLITKNYEVTITDNRSEGDVSSDNIIYHGISKTTGKSLTLKGSTLHTIAPDGSPSRFLGYRFHNGATTYLVLEEGRLQVLRGKSQLLVNEPGTWRN